MTVTELQADILGSLETALLDGWDGEDPGRTYWDHEPEYAAAKKLVRLGLARVSEGWGRKNGERGAHFAVLDAGMSGGTWTVEDEP